jgi:hypothetical protein
MKKTSSQQRLRKGGIMQWSTMCLLAGGSVALPSCDSESTYTATPEDVRIASLEKQLDEIEKRKAQLTSGEVENNFELPGLGFYHCEAKDFFPYRHGQNQDGKWYANGEWQDDAPAVPVPTASRPSTAALEKIQQLLEREQEIAKTSGATADQTTSTTTQHHYHHGSGVGSMLMMYWMLSGNRGGFTPGAGFQNAQRQESGWRGSLERDRQAVSSYAGANPGYSRLVQESRSSGAPVTAGSSVRGGFGSSSCGGSSFGS